MKNKKGITISKAFQKVLDDSVREQNKIWVDQGSEFYNGSLNSSLHDNGIKMYSTDSKEESVVAERFIRDMRKKIYKHLTTVSKSLCIEGLDKMVGK